ncbi:hypothetical protein B9S53_00600 [Arthrospira sp. O9.13F]|nr:hypothetical protein B9S53_00600 [Arthrospira sp. O9.13F]
MDHQDEKNQAIRKPRRTRSVRGNKESRNFNSDSKRDRYVGPDGEGCGSKSLGTGGADCQGNAGDQGRATEPTTSGKVNDLLEALSSRFMDYIKAHEERLEQRLAANRDFQESIKEQMEEIKKEILQQVSE